MQAIQKQFVVDNMNRKVAVQIDYKTFSKIEEILENYALYQLMEEYDDNKSFLTSYELRRMSRLRNQSSQITT